MAGKVAVLLQRSVARPGSVSHSRVVDLAGDAMLATIAALLMALWLLGFFAFLKS